MNGFSPSLSWEGFSLHDIWLRKLKEIVGPHRIYESEISMTSKRSFCKPPYDSLILSLHNIIISTLMSNWDYNFELAIRLSSNDSFWMMQLFYIFEIYILCHQLSKALVRFFSFMYQNPLWLCSWQILWKILLWVS